MKKVASAVEIAAFASACSLLRQAPLGDTLAGLVRRALLVRGGLGGRRLLFLGFDQFAFKANLELIADNQSAVQHHVERHPIVSSIDLALAAIGNAMAHHRVVELAKVGNGEGDRLGVALDGQVTRQLVAILADRLDLSALEGHRRVLVDLQDVRPTEIVVSLLVVGADARHLDSHVDRRRLRLLGIDVAAGLYVGEDETYSVRGPQRCRSGRRLTAWARDEHASDHIDQLAA